jgi:hypothetical protein
MRAIEERCWESVCVVVLFGEYLLRLEWIVRAF